MANFLRKFMHKNGNRSSETPSPSKFISSSNNEIDNDFHHFRIPSSLEPYPSSAGLSAVSREPVRRTHSSNYYEPSNEYFQLSTPQPPRRTFANNKHQKSPANFGSPRSKAASTQFLNNGLGSNEYLTETWNSSNPYNEIQADWSPKPRSPSPRKSPRETSRIRDEYDVTPKRSPKSTSKRRKPSISNTYDYLNPQCKAEGCSAAIIVEDARFLACKHQLSQASIFFRTLFIDHRAFPVSGVEQTSTNEFVVVVSGLRYPPPATQFRWFIESSIPCPIIKDITGNSFWGTVGFYATMVLEETLETCMRLSKRFEAKGLEVRCQKYICENVDTRPPIQAMCWLNWTLKHRFDKRCLQACLPVVARLSLLELEAHRKMITEKIMADLLAMKLRATYLQAGTVFQTIHNMDHFQINVEKCPRCNRQKEQGRVRVYANPCQKLIGCERCLPNYNQCELGKRLRGTDFQAFYQCEHGIWAFHEKTEECFCQAHLYKSQINADRAKIATLSNGETTDFVNGSPLPRERDEIYYGEQQHLQPPRSPSPNKSNSSKHRNHSRSKTYLNSAESS